MKEQDTKRVKSRVNEIRTRKHECFRGCQVVYAWHEVTTARALKGAKEHSSCLQYVAERYQANNHAVRDPFSKFVSGLFTGQASNFCSSNSTYLFLIWCFRTIGEGIVDLEPRYLGRVFLLLSSRQTEW